MKRISTNLASSILLVLGTYGLAQADTTYSYTYSYNWTVPSSGVNDCEKGSWLSSCQLSGGSRVSAPGNPTTPADPNAPDAIITSTATGWANTGGAAGTTATSRGNQTIEQGYVQAWNGTGGYGLGIKNKDDTSGEDGSNYDLQEGSSPEHAVDNNERYDSMLYSFSDAVALTSAQVTYSNTDTDNTLSDIIVLAYIGSDPFVNDASKPIETKLAGLKYDQLVSKGWQLIGNYANLNAGEARSINTGALTGGNTYNQIASSSYWLIGAANNLVVGGANNCGSSCTATKMDAIKLGALGATVKTSHTVGSSEPVPEPGSLALLGLGSLILVRARAKKS